MSVHLAVLKGDPLQGDDTVGDISPNGFKIVNSLAPTNFSDRQILEILLNLGTSTTPLTNHIPFYIQTIKLSKFACYKEQMSVSLATIRYWSKLLIWRLSIDKENELHDIMKSLR